MKSAGMVELVLGAGSSVAGGSSGAVGFGVRICETAKEMRWRAVGWVVGSSSTSVESVSSWGVMFGDDSGFGCCGSIRVMSSSSDDAEVGDEVADVSPPVVGFSMSVGGSSLGAGVDGRRDERRVWTARKAWCLPVNGREG